MTQRDLDEHRREEQETSLQELLSGPATRDIEDAGRFLGLGRTASYEAARKGILPTIRVGERRLRVPSARLAALLGAED